MKSFLSLYLCFHIRNYFVLAAIVAFVKVFLESIINIDIFALLKF